MRPVKRRRICDFWRVDILMNWYDVDLIGDTVPSFSEADYGLSAAVDTGGKVKDMAEDEMVDVKSQVA